MAPTFNEKENLSPFVRSLAAVLPHVAWELIVVDDDSPDGTAIEAARLASEGLPIRCIRRIGRRGLASAVVEGVLGAGADIVAVMDADLQHDETLLPRMLEILQAGDAELVLASRHVEGGSLGDWSTVRKRMSAFATRASRMLIGATVSDPMSGFFMTRRTVFEAAVYDLSQQGYKILLDLLTSSPRPLKVVELPYRFRTRQAGTSKVDVMILAEFAFLLIDKLTFGLVPPRFVLFSCIGGLGVGCHLLVLRAGLDLGASFLRAQAGATIAAMTFNYILNNIFTYRTNRLQGARFLLGYIVFCLVCSVGAIANISVANLTMLELGSWPAAGIAGALMSSVFNFGVATRLVWRSPRRRRAPVVVEGAVA